MGWADRLGTAFGNREVGKSDNRAVLAVRADRTDRLGPAVRVDRTDRLGPASRSGPLRLKDKG